MSPESESLSAVDRPDLEEFLSALNGFLDKQTTPEDPSYLRFLEIFCRSVGAGLGHLLKITERGELESVISCGISPQFDRQFNEAHKQALRQPSPLDVSFQKKKVVALVELKRGADCPGWFMDLMEKKGFKSLVAVPLLGQTKPVGILCAYYSDVCLFDKGTLDRLLVIGRMVGAATEKSLAVDRIQSHGAKEKVLDQFLRYLLAGAVNKQQLLGTLKKILVDSLSPTGLVCGMLQKEGDILTLTILDGQGIPMASMSKSFDLPPILKKKLLTGKWDSDPAAVSTQTMGSLAPLMKGGSLKILCEPFLWQNKLLGMILVWRAVGPLFDDDDALLLNRLAGLTSLALHVT